ncbi:MAG: aspartate/glutamate racemase family protein [Arenibacterium sp.]
MKKIGILGGVGWASTIDYYRGICAGANRHFEAQGASSPLPVPPITIESVVQARTRALRGTPGDEESWAAFDAVFREALQTLEAAGCDFAVMASNTPHTRLHAIRTGVNTPTLSIYDATAEATAAQSPSRALVLGTAVTMQSDKYPEALNAHGVQANPRLPEDSIAEMQAMIDEDFYGGAGPNARARLLDYCKRYSQPGDAILLACTELPLAFPDHIDDVVFSTDGFLFVNPSAAHIATALEKALNEAEP